MVSTGKIDTPLTCGFAIKIRCLLSKTETIYAFPSFLFSRTELFFRCLWFSALWEPEKAEKHRQRPVAIGNGDFSHVFSPERIAPRPKLREVCGLLERRRVDRDFAQRNRRWGVGILRSTRGVGLKSHTSRDLGRDPILPSVKTVDASCFVRFWGMALPPCPVLLAIWAAAALPRPQNAANMRRRGKL